MRVRDGEPTVLVRTCPGSCRALARPLLWSGYERSTLSRCRPFGVNKLAAISCELCESPGGRILWRGPLVRVVAASEPHYPGFCRVVLERHVAEMTDLTEGERDTVMRTVYAVEAALRELMAPDKINLASLGNMVAHLHWHVIPRFRDDPHFPGPVWAPARRIPSSTRSIDETALAAALTARLGPGVKP